MPRRGLWAAVFVVAVVIATAVLLVRDLPRRAAEEISKPKEEAVDLDVVVTRVRDLNRLETASMHVVHVGTVTQSYKLVPNAVAGDELTLFGAGDVIAGVDLSGITRDSVRREPDGTVVMRLPPAQILVSRLDNRETRVVARKTGLLRRADPGLEGRARQLAEIGIRQEAMKRGILQLAANNAEARLAGLLQAAGIRTVRFEMPRPLSAPR